MQLCPAAWRRRSATLLSTPPLSSTATRSGALLAAAHRTRCSSLNSTAPGAGEGALGGEAASGAADERARNGRGGRRGRGRGLGPGRRGLRRSGRRVETTRSMGGGGGGRPAGVAARGIGRCTGLGFSARASRGSCRFRASDLSSRRRGRTNAYFGLPRKYVYLCGLRSYEERVSLSISKCPLSSIID